MFKHRLIAIVMSGLIASTAFAQRGPGGIPADAPRGPEAGPGGPAGMRRHVVGGMVHQGGAGIFESLFPPELIMQHQKAISLTDEQTSAIKIEVRESGQQFFDLTWKQKAEEEALQALLKVAVPDEAQVLAQFDKLVGVENQIKRARIQMLIKVKSILTAEQQEKLRGLAPSPESRRPGPGLGGPQRPLKPGVPPQAPPLDDPQA